VSRDRPRNSTANPAPTKADLSPRDVSNTRAVRTIKNPDRSSTQATSFKESPSIQFWIEFLRGPHSIKNDSSLEGCSVAALAVSSG
jgi:hypothetical protein